jgi:hypothetical protein
MEHDAHILEMVPGHSIRVSGVSIEMIHGLIKWRQVEYDFYNVTVNISYGMNLYMFFFLPQYRINRIYVWSVLALC